MQDGLYIMYRKAKLLGDNATADAILAAKTPAEHQQLGQNAQRFNDKLWHGIRQVVPCVDFMQNSLKMKR